MIKKLIRMSLNNKNPASMAAPRPINYLPIYTDEINQSLISLAYHQANIGLFTGLICASIIWYRLHSYVTGLSLNFWFVTILAVTLLRAILVNVYLTQKHTVKHPKQWRRLFILGTTLGGISWGLVAFTLMPYAHNNDHVLILMVLAGITAGAVAFMAGILPAAILFLVTALLPVCLHYSLNHTDYLIGVAIFVYLAFLLVQTKRINIMLQNGLLLQFELKEAKDHDPLTNAANRNLFNLNFERAIEAAKKAHTKVVLLYFDLNKFKSINDVYGHQTGDQILVIFVERLKSIFKEKDMVARLGGDEFTVIINPLPSCDDTSSFVKQINKVLEAPAYINNKKIKIQVSLGISVYPIDGHDMETLLNVADNRMYGVKKALP